MVCLLLCLDKEGDSKVKPKTGNRGNVTITSVIFWKSKFVVENTISTKRNKFVDKFTGD